MVTAPHVVFETVYTLQRFYDVPRDRIRDVLVPIISLPDVQMTDKHACIAAFDLYVQHARLSFADAFSAAFMRSNGLIEIYSWDQDFDRIARITRIEPTNR